MELPYKAPIKLYNFNRRLKIVDPQSREVVEFSVNSFAIDYHKRHGILINFIIELMNGKKRVEYDPNTQSYQVFDQIQAPASAAIVPVEIKKEPEQPRYFGTSVPSIVDKTVQALKKRGRPKKK